jgi:glycosyltransferase involved in cell wall biosynthesis
MEMRNIYFFQWPSNLGGADTRLKELIQLFDSKKDYNLFCVPNDNVRLEEAVNVNFLKKNNVKIITWDQLPEKAAGFAISFCNFRLFKDPWRLHKIKRMGLKFIWSNDMMWSTQEEVESFNQNLVDAAIYTSEFHKFQLLKVNPYIRNIKSFIVPNYFFPNNYQQKTNKDNKFIDKFVIGKLSRGEWTKYSENFPLFYRKIPISNAKFRFMGWNEKLAKKYSWFKFNADFDLLKENEETLLQFLSQLDLYLFNCHHNYTENQSRSLIEAQLMGVPCIVPNEGNFPNMIWHERSGYVYNTIEECYDYISKLSKNRDLLNLMKHNARNLSRLIWCNSESQLNSWEDIFKFYE